MSYTKLYHTSTNIKNESKNEKQKMCRIYCTYNNIIHKIISYTNKLPIPCQHMLLVGKRNLGVTALFDSSHNFHCSLN